MTNKFINKSVISALLLISTFASNVTISSELVSSSFGELSSKLTNDIRHIVSTESSHTMIPDQYIGKATGKTRAEMIAEQVRQIPQTKSLLQTKSYNHYADFYIYGATTLLQDDYDSDGFYQTFSVIFDADMYSFTQNPLAEVYALLYISKNGGPWTHYYTTDDFLIQGDSEFDEYEVMTSFLSGYSTDHYDILIDLYQIGYSDIVATYSSNDSSALYALPLESVDYDEPYIEVIEVTHGGSFPTVLIVFLMLAYVIRTISNKESF